MKTTKRISFDANHVPGGVQAINEIITPLPEEVEILWPQGIWKQTRMFISLACSDPRLGRLLRFLQEHEIDWGELVFDVYSIDETMTARLVFVSPNPGCEIDGGPEFGTSYDLTEACPRCGTGATQTSALIVGGEDVEKLRNASAGQTYYDDLLVHEKVVADLEAAGLTGLLLHRVYESLGSTQRRLPWRHILAERTLPRMASSTTGIIRGRICSVCQRQGYCMTQKEPLRIVYREDDLLDAQDVNATWEWFGYTPEDLPFPEGFVARPGILVSPKVVKIFMGHGVTAFDFIPIRVEPTQPSQEA